MVFKNFRINTIIRILVFVLIIGAFFYCIYLERYLRSIYVAIALVIAVAEFIRYVDKTNRDFTSFLSALSQNDFTTRYAEQGKGKSFNKLYSVFNKITSKFRTISEEKEAQFIFLSLLVEHVRVGILSIDQHDHVHLINDSMKKYFGTHAISTLRNLPPDNEDLVRTIREIKVGENRMIKVMVSGKLTPLTVHATELKIKEEYYKLISVQNIYNELEINELESWQKLIRVLTHEIMNSVSPIISLSGTLSNLVNLEAIQNKLDLKNYETLQKGLEAIKLRSHGLQHFADAYRSLTRIPQPQFKKVKIKKILEQLRILFEEEINNRGIRLITSDTNQELEILVDPELLEQVLINILKNAFDGVQQSNDPAIEIQIHTTPNGGVSIYIIDNGTGIPEEMLDKIFIPFFTTKKSGSGIGLALSKQIIQLHSGQIFVESKVGVGTHVEIRL